MNTQIKIFFLLTLVVGIPLVIKLIRDNQKPYDPILALQVLHMAKVAQCGGSGIENWSCPSCRHFPNMRDFKVFENSTHEAQGYAGYDPDSNFIAVGYRGSANTENWISDFDFLQVKFDDCSSCRVHAGFFRTYNDLRDQTLDHVNFLKYKYPNAKIAVTGHSLGAAMSTLAALDISQNIALVDVHINYGSPRVGNKQFAEHVAATLPYVYRVVHYKDIVPHLPFLEMDFHHIATEVWYNVEDSSSYVVCQPSGEDLSCADSVIEMSPADHDPYMGISASCN